jgi:hypothetical protein
MDLFNRIVVTLLVLALIPIFTVVLIVPHEAIQLVQDGLDQLANRVDPSVTAGRLIIGGVLVVLVDGLLVFLLYLQVRRPSARAAAVQQVKDGQAQIAVSSIASRLEYHIDRLPGVLDIKPKIVAHRRGVEVLLEVETAADVNMPDKIEEISAVTRQVVEEEMGLRLKGKPQLNLRTVGYPEPTTTTPVEPQFLPLADQKVDRDEPALFEGEEPELFSADDSLDTGEGE